MTQKFNQRYPLHVYKAQCHPLKRWRGKVQWWRPPAECGNLSQNVGILHLTQGFQPHSSPYNASWWESDNKWIYKTPSFNALNKSKSKAMKYTGGTAVPMLPNVSKIIYKTMKNKKIERTTWEYLNFWHSYSSLLLGTHSLGLFSRKVKACFWLC